MMEASRDLRLVGAESEFVDSEDGYKALIARAWELVPTVASRAREAEAMGRIPDNTIQLLCETGLMRAGRAASFGGYSQPPELLFEVASILARGCLSTSWVYLNLSSHELMLAAWPVEAMREVWSVDPDAMIATSFIFAAGRAKKVQGGYSLSGRWPFCSGVHPSTWNIMAAMVEPEEGKRPEMRIFLVHRDQYRIIDNWDVTALKGTGSNDVEANDTFVPEHRTISYFSFLHGNSPGFDFHKNERWIRFPQLTAGTFLLFGPILGAARGALEQFTERARKATDRLTGKAMASDPIYQSKIAEASGLVDMAELMARTMFRELQDGTLAGELYNDKRALMVRRNCALSAKMCVDAVDLLFNLAGGSALYNSNPLQRAWRDIHGGYAHAAFRWDVHGTNFGRVELGLPSNLPGFSV
jgi:3-hydroxy-9,10-secoandrosta-1,3,5(10)-triene-9,17-dione monooxygenase